eukprot:m51a1_g10808 hypothetical protein (243) ;mRNA; f:769-1497
MKLCHNVEINIGTGCEELLRPCIVHYLPNSDWPNDPGAILAIVRDKLAVMQKDGNFAPLEDISALYGRTWSWMNETGIDGVQFALHKAAGEGWHITVNGWQLKVVHSKAKLGGGECDTFRRKAIAEALAKNVDGDVIAGIMVEAEIGFIKLVAALLRTFDEKIAGVQLGTLVVTTTAGNVEPARTTLGSGRTAVPLDLCTAFGLQKDRRVKMSYTVKLHHGLSWLTECLNPVLLSRFPAGSK